MSEERFLIDGKPHDGPTNVHAWVPEEVATCPECGGRLLVEINAWETDTGSPLEEGDGIYLDCEHENEPDDDGDYEPNHRSWQGEWAPVMDKVHAWAMKHVRVPSTPAPTTPEEGTGYGR